jgi:site-specific DNA-adenine methylase
MNKLFGYMGGKARYVDILNTYINKSDKNIYVEPFLGSGVVLLNLEKEFDQYIVGELNSSLLNIFNQLSKNSEDKIISTIEKFESKINFRKKEEFYKFRDWWNERLYKTNTFAEAIGLIILITCSINNASRFGPNGYNQSFGNRFFTDVKKKKLMNAAKRLRSLNGKIIFCNDWSLCLLPKTKNNALCYLDPPYYLSTGAGINGKVWTEIDAALMIKKVKAMNYDVVYTDIKNPYGDMNFKNHKKLNILKEGSVRPGKSKRYGKTYNEVLYYKIGE